VHRANRGKGVYRLNRGRLGDFDGAVARRRRGRAAGVAEARLSHVVAGLGVERRADAGCDGGRRGAAVSAAGGLRVSELLLNLQTSHVGGGANLPAGEGDLGRLDHSEAIDVWILVALARG
jgi:hypothetical protein